MNESRKVSGLVNEWLASVEPRIARSTYVKYEQLARNYIVPYFDTITCKELDNNQLHRFCSVIHQKESTSKRPLSVGNQRTIFMIMNNTLDYAYDSAYWIKDIISAPDWRVQGGWCRYFPRSTKERSKTMCCIMTMNVPWLSCWRCSQV